MDRTIELSAANAGMRLCLAINYGGRAELVDAVRADCRAGASRATGRRRPSTKRRSRRILYTAGRPDPDLLIRTAGEMRVSNFLLWQISYAELWVTSRFWPEFRTSDLHEAIARLRAARSPFGGIRPSVTTRCRMQRSVVSCSSCDCSPPPSSSPACSACCTSTTTCSPRCPGVWLLPLALVAAVLMVYELLDLWRDRPDRPPAWPVYAGALLTVAARPPRRCSWQCTGQPYPRTCPLGHLGWPLFGMAAGVVLAFVAEMARYTQPGLSTGSIALSVLAIGYAGLLLSFLVSLRFLPDPHWGMAAVVSVIVIVKLSDTGAYFTGRAVGRHKMSPVLSPKKTVEGAVGGWSRPPVWAPGCVGLDRARAWSAPTRRGALLGWLLLRPGAGRGGMLGDLAESLLKRDAQRKDSSSWLPGLGGVLDFWTRSCSRPRPPISAGRSAGRPSRTHDGGGSSSRDGDFVGQDAADAAAIGWDRPGVVSVRGSWRFAIVV